MGFPVIQIDSTDGAASDSACSGAGPATALTGSAATTDAGGTVVSLDGSPDLSGVAVDGTHVLFYNDTTAGARRFTKITAKDDGADTVTVNPALATSHGATAWAIGGIRATLLGAISLLLIDNNSAAGDAMPGWIMRMLSGHAENSSSTIIPRRTGNTTDGFITIEGEDGAGTKPVLTCTANVNGVRQAAHSIFMWKFKDFTMLNTNGTKTSTAFNPSGYSASYWHFEGLTIGASGSGWGYGIGLAAGQRVFNCEIDSCTTYGINLNGNNCLIQGNYIHDCGNAGIFINSNTGFDTLIYRNILADNSYGIYINFGARQMIYCNTFYSQTNDGLWVSSTFNSYLYTYNNIFVDNGGYGIDLNGSTALKMLERGPNSSNAFYNNTSGTWSTAGVGIDDITLSADPFTAAGSSDFSLNNTAGGGADCREAGYPSVFPAGLTTSYPDVGAAQHQDSGGGGSGGAVKQAGRGGGMAG